MKSNILENFQNLKPTDKNICLLHSAQKGINILATNPVAEFKGNDLEKFKEFAKKNKKKLLIGYISYDSAYNLYSLKPKAKNDLNLPSINFFAFDNWKEEITTRQNKFKTKNLEEKIKFEIKISKEDYKKAFNKIKNYIKEGDIYQINLTHRLEAKTEIAGKDLFLKIAEKNPVDYLAYLQTDNAEILSASPEKFIKIKNNIIETCPIKGTRPRGKNKEEDLELSKELIASEKEASELNMITDLLRNDLGKVCKIGSVKVKGHRILQKCPTVWHTYSRIVGELKTTPIEALISMLPGGSITGCPKKRAIEIIDELEPTMRGIYTGVIGYVMPNQKELNFSIAIRTIIKKGENLYLQVGGGIVNDSKEKDEFEETMNKALSFQNLFN
ncbi:MAG: anthranilate synthase component I family protein [Candidatus Peregrinibacteria bacterium]|nr:anthranilate synthase component I family protein [Candidatus Peregrinibacteria bacterium]